MHLRDPFMEIMRSPLRPCFILCGIVAQRKPCGFYAKSKTLDKFIAVNKCGHLRKYEVENSFVLSTYEPSLISLVLNFS